jgi:hypothetical protein
MTYYSIDMMRVAFILLLELLNFKVVCAQFDYDRIPIIAFIGVPASQTSEERFREFRDAGFDVSLNSYPDKRTMRKALDIAHETGVSLMLHCPELFENPQKTSEEFCSHPALFAYYIADEPNKAKLDSLSNIVQKINAVDSLHSCYINMFPYIDDYSLKLTQFATYEDYIDSVSNMKLHFLSFDFYPITTKGVRKNWYNNLELIREQSLKVNKPFYAFVLSTPHVDYPKPTLNSLMLQINVNLAYGAQALQYFTYWTPRPNEIYDFNNGPISNDGKRTRTYKLVSKANRSVLPHLYLFYNARVKNISHLGGVFEDAYRTGKYPENVLNMSVEGECGVMLSEFEKNGISYFCVVNKDYKRKTKIKLEYSSNDVKMLIPNKKAFKLKKTKTEYTLRPSEMIVFRTK